MTLNIPGYIKRANIENAPIDYAWTEEATEFLGEERLANRIRPICPRGIVALTTGFAEWVAWRLHNGLNDPILLDYIEAAWAGIIDWRYLKARKSVPGAPYYLKDWTGTTRGAVIQTCNFLDEVIRGAQEGMGAGLSAASLSQLALYVMPSPKPFKEWRRFAIGRLAALYPEAEEGDIGPPIPREVLDPEFEYKPEMADDLLRNFLQSLDSEQNPFLASPKEMITEGFPGTPYNF
ncbi:MAG: hypothetical protein H6R26_2321 [Proteobacteria bacterium]|nr:hypothetical protein [Pseudomonadota bacterium]